MSEVFLSSIPGALLQFIFIVSAAGLNIMTNQGSTSDSTYALVYLPVVCLLPLVVGAISTLMHERVQGVHVANIKSSMLTAMMAAFIGTFVGAIVIIIAGVLKAKPLGGGMTDMLFIVSLPLVMIVMSTILAGIGSAVVVGVLNKMEK